MKFILGKKLGMTTLYTNDGTQNVTLIECAPNTVSQVRTMEKDSYKAVQLTCPKTKNKELVKEFRVEDDVEIDVKEGDKLTVEVFEVGDKVKVSGTSKGKGFQGVVKRHGFAGSPATHGHRHDLRAPGSIGAQQPQRVIKGKKMAGRMGCDRVSLKNVAVVSVDKDQNIIAVRGAVPGISGSMVEVRA